MSGNIRDKRYFARDDALELQPAIERELVAMAQNSNTFVDRLPVELVLFHSHGPAARAYIHATFDVPQQAPMPDAPLSWTAEELRDEQNWFWKGSSHGEEIQWASCRVNGTEFTLFNGIGPRDPHQLFVGIDWESDQTIDQLLPTGLSEQYCDGNFIGGPKFARDGKRCSFAAAPSELIIGHHMPVFEAAGSQRELAGQLSGSRFIHTTVQLSDLQRDSDGDRLTDRTEAVLYLNPQNPDTDGDGLQDAVDPAPNSNATTANLLERGVARALLFKDRLIRERSGESRKPIQPADLRTTVFISTRGLRAPGAALPGCRTIYVDSQYFHESTRYTITINDDPMFPNASAKDALLVSIAPPGCLAGPPIRLVLIDEEFYPLPTVPY
jgi:hypothetical protein